MSLDGKTALVTGAGRGIGAAVAEALARAGAAVAVCARTAEQVEAVAARLRGSGARAQALTCDVTDAAGVTALCEAVRRELGGVDVLVNNAGAASSAPLARTSLEDWNRALAVNATSVFLCTQAVLPAMLERGWGRVVNVASVAGLSGASYISAYASAKHAAVGFTRCIAAEVEGQGVTVNALCPGFVDTPMTERSLENIVAKTGLSRAAALASMLASASQQRLVTPGEVAEEVLRLCGDGAQPINGQAIVLDGSARRA